MLITINDYEAFNSDKEYLKETDNTITAESMDFGIKPDANVEDDNANTNPEDANTKPETLTRC